MAADFLSLALDYHRGSRPRDPSLEARVLDVQLRRVLISSAQVPGACWAWIYDVAPAGVVWIVAFAGCKETREQAEAAAEAEAAQDLAEALGEVAHAG